LRTKIRSASPVFAKNPVRESRFLSDFPLFEAAFGPALLSAFGAHGQGSLPLHIGAHGGGVASQSLAGRVAQLHGQFERNQNGCKFVRFDQK